MLNELLAAAEPPVECRVGRKWKDTDSLAFALECAADFLEQEEWPEDDGGKQMAANREAARRIRRMARRLVHNAQGKPTAANEPNKGENDDERNQRR